MPNPFERAEYAAGNLAHGDFVAAAQSLVSPDSLTPEQQKSVADRFLGGKPGLMSHVLKVATNPLVIVGAVLAMKYPIPRAINLLKYRDELNVMSRTEFPGLKWLPDLYEIFDKKTSALIEHATSTVHRWNEVWVSGINRLLGEYSKRGGSITTPQMVKAAAALDDLENPRNRAWEFLRKTHPEGEKLLPKNVSPVVIDRAGPDYYLKDGFDGLHREQFKLFGEIGGMSDANVISQINKRLRKTYGHEFDITKIKTIKHYFPHIESLTKEQADKVYAEWASKMGVTEGTYNRVVGESLGNVLADQLLPRMGMMLPSEEHLRMIGAWTPNLEKLYKYADAVAAANGKTVRRYSLNALETYRNYTHGLARTLAWSVPPPGGSVPTGKQLLEQLAKYDMSDRHRAAILRGTYIPLMSGHLTWSQGMQSMWYSGIRQKAAAAIKKMPIPEDLRGFLLKPFEAPVGWGFHSVGHKITNWFYGTSLAFNMLSPVANLTQSLLTSIPMMGVGNWMKGAAEATRRGKNVLKLMFEDGRTFEDAVKIAMPEFAKSGLNVGTFAARRELQGLIDAANQEIGVPGKVGTAWEKFQKYGMSFFTGTETFNRAAHYYGARNWFMKDAVGERWLDVLTNETHLLKAGSSEMHLAANEFAALTTRAAHYGGGLLGTPRGTASWWSPLKQYTQFPLRTAGFFAGPALRMGSENGKMNFGVLGRALVASGVAVGAGKELAGIDLSRMMMFGSIPTLQEPSESNPLGVLPLAPPLVQLGAAGAASLATGDTSYLQRQIPMMVPGGVQMARLAQVLSPGISTAIGRQYADYSQRTPSGKIPLMSKEGRLVMELSPLQVWARAAGVPVQAISHEAELAKYLIGQRDKIRDLRLRYTNAISNGDTRTASNINAEYQHLYPGLGPLMVKKSDIRAARIRREVPRLDRIMKTLPPEARGQFAEAVSVALGSGAAQSLENGTPFMLPPSSMGRSGYSPPKLDTGITPPSSDEAGSSSTSFEGFGSFD